MAAGRDSSSSPEGRHDEAPFTGESAASSGGLLADAGSLFHSLHGVAHDYLVLVALETKRAGLSLAIIVAAGVGIAILLVTAWMGIALAAALALVSLGLAPSLATLLVVAANIAISFGLYRLIAHKRHDLAFPATVRNLQPSASRSGQADSA